jgi:hypothetical protein
VLALMAVAAMSQRALAQGFPASQRIVQESSTFTQGAPENVRSLA